MQSRVARQQALKKKKQKNLYTTAIGLSSMGFVAMNSNVHAEEVAPVESTVKTEEVVKEAVKPIEERYNEAKVKVEAQEVVVGKALEAVAKAVESKNYVELRVEEVKEEIAAHDKKVKELESIGLDVLNQKLDNAKADVTKQESDIKDQKQVLESLNEQLESRKENVVNAEKERDQAQVDVEKAEAKKLEAVRLTEEIALTTNDTEREVLRTRLVELGDVDTQLDKAKEGLVYKQVLVEQWQGLTEAMEEFIQDNEGFLTELENKLAQLNTQVDNAQADVDYMTNADILSEAYVNKLATYERHVKDSTAEVAKLQGIYDGEKVKLDELLLAYKPIKEEYDLFLKIKAEQERLAKEQEEQKQAEQKQAEQKQAEQKQAEQRRIQAEQQANGQANATAGGRQLPQTGDAQTGLGLVGLGLAMLGALGFRKRDEK